MGIDARLENERGEPVAVADDPNGLFADLVAGAGGRGPVCLRFIDPHGDTAFNRHQMAALIPELEAALAEVAGETAREHGRAVLRLARRCRDGVHLYLKFVGD